MTMFERVQELAKRKDKTLKEISLELGFSKNYMYTLKNQEPSADKLRAIADYFNVSTDYLLGREISSNPAETDLEKMLDNAMSFDGKPMSDHDREVILAFLKGKFNK